MSFRHPAPEFSIEDCAGSLNKVVLRRTKLSTIDVTAKTMIYKRLVLISEWLSVAKFVKYIYVCIYICISIYTPSEICHRALFQNGYLWQILSRCSQYPHPHRSPCSYFLISMKKIDWQQPKKQPGTVSWVLRKESGLQHPTPAYVYQGCKSAPTLSSTMQVALPSIYIYSYIYIHICRAVFTIYIFTIYIFSHCHPYIYIHISMHIALPSIYMASYSQSEYSCIHSLPSIVNTAVFTHCHPHAFGVSIIRNLRNCRVFRGCLWTFWMI